MIDKERYGLPVKAFLDMATPFYYYDGELLDETLKEAASEAGKYDGFVLHYAVKANSNPEILKRIAAAGLGADIVTGWELRAALEAGIPGDKIVYSGVGKTDWEIRESLANDIYSLNVESIPELEVINELAGEMGKRANVALRINPNVGAHTHSHITTGLAENKFGIALHQLDDVVAKAKGMDNVNLRGLHFHIGSQILEMNDFEELCHRINEILRHLKNNGWTPEMVDVGGGLGIDYEAPEAHPIPDFASYFATFGKYLKPYPGQTLHFELGRALVGQCGSLISRVTYVKEGTNKKFVILDAGMNDLIRPALYGARHKIENLVSYGATEKYDVVGPICESSDVFAAGVSLPITRRGDLIAIRSAGAYGEVMASRYNCRPFAPSIFSEAER